ncbi:hypothetical protein SMMN14_01120 [Sphaerulina musiva]
MSASPVDEEHERDGRFYGPDVNWRRYTSDERDLAASLDQIENDDLSAHLYNTHRIKHRQKYRDSSTIRTWQSKQSWLAHGQAAFSPDRAWSAWPLESADVPRRDEKWGVSAAVEDNEYETYRRPEVWRPSVDLQDCVQAEILRQAKERFYQRKCLGARSHPLVTDSASDPRSSAMSHDEDSDASSLMSEADTQPSASTKRDGEEHTGGDTSDREAQTRFTADEEVAGAVVQTTGFIAAAVGITEIDLGLALGLQRPALPVMSLRRQTYSPSKLMAALLLHEIILSGRSSALETGAKCWVLLLS